MRRREGRQPRCWVAPEAKVCARGFVNKVGRAVCGLRFADASRISAVWGSTSRDLSIGTLHYGALSRYYSVLQMVIKLPRSRESTPVAVYTPPSTTLGADPGGPPACSCNDGGPGAEYADCIYGSDCWCADCGPRFPPPPPICAETCNWASDADCDDGGPGSGSARPGPTACGTGPSSHDVVTKVTVVCT